MVGNMSDIQELNIDSGKFSHAVGSLLGEYGLGWSLFPKLLKVIVLPPNTVLLYKKTIPVQF